MRTAITIVALGLALLVLPATDALASGCTGEVRGEKRRVENEEHYSDWTFAVHVKAFTSCGTVYWDAVFVEQLPNGETKEVRKPMKRRVRSGTQTIKYRYRVNAENKLVSWKFEVKDCTPCGAESTP